MMRTGSSQTKSRAGFGRRFGLAFLGALGGLLVLAGVAGLVFFFRISHSLPSTQALKHYHPALVSSIYAADGSLAAEFYTQRRYLVPLQQLPPHLIKAFLAAEDVRFYEHGGIDLQGIVRAFFRNLKAGMIVQGGSTITQQVVKSLLLSPERSWTRKLKEAILANRIDRTLSKDEILELYLNQIYFGAGAYGVEAAARTYFGKHAAQVNLSQAALLAGLPKAPSRFSPLQNLAAARERQKYVLQRMVEAGFISSEQARAAYAAPLDIVATQRWGLTRLNSFTEEVRRRMEARYGHERLYEGGLQIYTTLEPRAQKLAEAALEMGLREIDRRHRYYGAAAHVAPAGRVGYEQKLAAGNRDLTAGRIVGALVVGYRPATGSLQLQLGSAPGSLPPAGWAWTGLSAQGLRNMLHPGDVIRVRLETLQQDGTWTTSLEPNSGVQGALLAMVPQTGRVLCMVGGEDFAKSQFNRAIQAIRQPGSAFKPIIYAAALDKGYTEASILIDSPIVREDPSLKEPWRPANYDRKFRGPILLRDGLIHSRNVVTIKLLDAIGIPYAIDYARRLGIASPLTPTLSLALGASGVSLWELTRAYSAFADQGERVEPYLIEKVVDRHGRVLEEHQVQKERVISPQTAYVITDLLQGVIREGTGRRARALNRPAAGKTGTTNDLRDAWFMGYTPSLLTGVWVGYDDHTLSMGKGETGSRAACPIWLYFMQNWLQDKPIGNFSIPPGVVFTKIDDHTGLPARPNDPHAIYAAFTDTRGPSQSDAARQLSGAASEKSAPRPPPSFFKSDLF